MIINKICSILSAAKHLSSRMRVPRYLYSYDETKAILSALCYQEILTAKHQPNQPFKSLQNHVVNLTKQYVAKQSSLGQAAGVNKRNYNKQAVDEMIAMFTTGIYINSLVFDQDRVRNAHINKRSSQIKAEQPNGVRNADNKNIVKRQFNDRLILIDFRPTFMVTQPIFDFFEQNKSKQSMIFGPQGISKTFSAILYHLLSLNINTYLLKSQMPSNQFYHALSINRQDIGPPQKIIYWSIDPLNSSVPKIMKNIVLQCPGIEDNQKIKSLIREATEILYSNSNEQYNKEKLKQKLRTFCAVVANIYGRKEIQITVLIDQINVVASVFRDYNAKIKEIRTKFINKKKRMLKQFQKNNIQNPNPKLSIEDIAQDLQNQEERQKQSAINRLEMKHMENAYQIANILRQLGDKVIYNSSKSIQKSLLFKSQKGQKTLNFDDVGFNTKYVDFESMIQERRGKQQFASIVVSELDQRVPEFAELNKLIHKGNKLEQQKLSFFEQYNWPPYCRFLSIRKSFMEKDAFSVFKAEFQKIRQKVKLEGQTVSVQIINQANQCLKQFASNLIKQIQQQGAKFITSQVIKAIGDPDARDLRDTVFMLLYDKAQTLVQKGEKTNKVVLGESQLTKTHNLGNQYDCLQNQFSTFEFYASSEKKVLTSYTLNLSPEWCLGVLSCLVKVSPKKVFHIMMRDYDAKYYKQNMDRLGWQIQKEIIRNLNNQTLITIKGFDGKEQSFKSTFPALRFLSLNLQNSSIEKNFKEALDQDNLIATKNKILCLPVAQQYQQDQWSPQIKSIDFLFSSMHKQKQNTVFIESVDVTVILDTSYIKDDKIPKAIAEQKALLEDHYKTSKRKVFWTHYIWTAVNIPELDKEISKHCPHPQSNIVLLNLPTLLVNDIKHRDSNIKDNYHIADLKYTVKLLKEVINLTKKE